MEFEDTKPAIDIEAIGKAMSMHATFCANCWPKPRAAFFLWYGLSLCPMCFESRRKAVDSGELGELAPGLDKRDYKSTWGEEPQKD